ncbi:MAG TPA: hypothetical protein VHO72_05925, partial [Bacteroidales bacterium]|nr:hypothetical protein [Bacteroidales bacterium]
MKPTWFLVAYTVRNTVSGFHLCLHELFHRFSIFVFAGILLCACGSIKPTLSGTVSSPQDTSENPEYNYSFAEATKLKLLGNSVKAIPFFFRCISLKPQNAASY